MHPCRDRHLPPELNDLIAWSTLFRSVGTFANYIGHVRTACLITEASTKVRVFLFRVGCGLSCCLSNKVFDDPALRRVKSGIAKRGNFDKRPKMWIQRLEALVKFSFISVCMH